MLPIVDLCDKRFAIFGENTHVAHVLRSFIVFWVYINVDLRLKTAEWQLDKWALCCFCSVMRCEEERYVTRLIVQVLRVRVGKQSRTTYTAAQDACVAIKKSVAATIEHSRSVHSVVLVFPCNKIRSNGTNLYPVLKDYTVWEWKRADKVYEKWNTSQWQHLVELIVTNRTERRLAVTELIEV